MAQCRVPLIFLSPRRVSPSPRYRIVSTLGKGGMGEVFLADDTQLERKVALKFLPEALERDPQARERFQREAKSAAALDHPFICKIYEVTEADGRPCIAMEYVVGETLEARLERGRLKLREVVALGTEVAEALEEAHGHRIVHRDLKPANIMLTGGHVKVMDFGLAKRLGDGEAGSDASSGGLTQSGMWVGTPAYMSPEQRTPGTPRRTRSGRSTGHACRHAVRGPSWGRGCS